MRDINDASVMEVINLANGFRGLLPRPMSFSGSFITAFEAAQNLAWKDVYGDSELTWTDIREKEMSKVKGAARKSEDFQHKWLAIRGALAVPLRQLPTRLGSTWADVETDWAADITNIALARSVDLGESTFWTQMWLVYRSGGWACGWEGEYPQGNVVGFFPG